MTDPAEGTKDLLVTAGVGTFGATTGWGIYISKEPESPDSVITITNAGDHFPANPKWLLDYPTVQVRVRGDKGGYQAAHAKAIEVRDALLGLPSQTLNGDVWEIVVEVGGINWLGFDEQNRPRMSMNYNLTIQPATGTNRLALP